MARQFRKHGTNATFTRWARVEESQLPHQPADCFSAANGETTTRPSPRRNTEGDAASDVTAAVSAGPLLSVVMSGIRTILKPGSTVSAALMSRLTRFQSGPLSDSRSTVKPSSPASPARRISLRMSCSA